MANKKPRTLFLFETITFALYVACVLTGLGFLIASVGASTTPPPHQGFDPLAGLGSPHASDVIGGDVLIFAYGSALAIVALVLALTSLCRKQHRTLSIIITFITGAHLFISAVIMVLLFFS